MIINSRAPARIDLAGGTLDLWPLYLFVKDPVTINMGISLWASAQLELSNDAGPSEVCLRSDDQKAELKFKGSELGSITAPPQLQLHLKLLRHFATKKQLPSRLTLSTSAQSPAGAGLGGSSTLAVAITGALATWAEDHFTEDRLDVLTDGERLVEIIRDIETTVIQVPAGVQDYYGAMFGGLQSLRWGAGSHHREWLPADVLKGLEERVLLFYSGQSRNSGINNWALFKDCIDNREGVRGKFEAITAASNRLEAALRKADWKGAGDAIAEEWKARSSLASGISTPEINRAFDEARKEGAVAGKICGAGGGGCFFVYLAEPDSARASKIRSKIEALGGIRSLPFQCVPRGLEVQVKRA